MAFSSRLRKLDREEKGGWKEGKGRTGRGGLTKTDVPQREQEEGGGGREKATLLGWELWARKNCAFEMVYRKGYSFSFLERVVHLLVGETGGRERAWRKR